MPAKRERRKLARRQKFILDGVLLFFILAGLFIIGQFGKQVAAPQTVLDFVNGELGRQQKIERELQAYYQAGSYTFEAPLVVQDSYQVAPLSALVIFDTPGKSQVSLHVPGKTALANVDFTFPAFVKHHEIALYGLYAGMVNHVTLRMVSEAGASAQTVLDVQTEAMPVDMAAFHVDVADPQKYSPGFNFTTLGEKSIFDINGDIRWYSTQSSWEVFTKLQNGRYLFTYDAKGSPHGSIILERDLLGKIYAAYYVEEGIHHDIYEMPGGSFLVTTDKRSTGTIEDVLVEMNRKSGRVTRSFDFKDILDPDRPGQPKDTSAIDWLHMNSVVYDSTDGTIIVSSKAQSVVVKLTYPGMQVRWIMGPHDNWSAQYQPYLLTPVGANFEWAWGQHHATLYGPNAPGDGKVDILLFDNALLRSYDLETAAAPADSYSRVVHYCVDEQDMTVEQVWEYGQARGTELFSASRGSAMLLPNGNVLGNWADIYLDAAGNPAGMGTTTGSVLNKVIEVDPQDGTVVFEATANTINYRAFRTGLYDGYSERSSYFEGQAKNTLNATLVERYENAWVAAKHWGKRALYIPYLLVKSLFSK